MEIQNVVASVDLQKKLPIDELLTNLEESEYQPDTFPGLIFRIKDPSATFLIFQTGKVVCVGSKNMKDAKNAMARLVKKIKTMGISIPKDYSVKIENIVATDNLGKKLHVDDLVFKLEDSEYTPDTFPGVVYRIHDPKASFLLFSSGRIVCAGTRTMAEAKKAIELLRKKLKEVRAL